MKRIASVTPIWNNEVFIQPHFSMLSSLDKNIVILGKAPWEKYKKEYALSSIPDGSEQILKTQFPDVEIVMDAVGDYGSELYNQGLRLLEEYDMVLKLDVDMLFTKKDWKTLISFIREEAHDAYRMDYTVCNQTYAFGFLYGVRGAEEEKDYIAVSPKEKFTGLFSYPAKNEYTIDWKDFTCHHFRGWKPNKKDRCQGKTALACPEELVSLFDYDKVERFN